MNVYSFSPLQSTVNYCKAEDFNPQLFFVDNNSTLKYSIIASVQIRTFDNTLIQNKLKLIQNGILNGKLNWQSNQYDYRFDFTNLIDFQIDEKLGVIDGDTTQSEYIKTIFLVLSNSYYVLEQYPNDFAYNDGSYYTTETHINSWSLTGKFKYNFLNSESHTETSVDRVIPLGAFSSMNLYPNDSINRRLRALLYASDGSAYDIQLNNAVGSKNVMSKTFFVPNDVIKVEFWLWNVDNGNTTLEYTVYPTKMCHISPNAYVVNHDIGQIIYYDKNCSLKTFSTTATKFIENDVQKEYITLANKKISKTNKRKTKLHQNTGYGIRDFEMYDIVNSAFLWTMDDTASHTNIKFNKWLNETNSFSGFVGFKANEKNIELILTKELDVKNYNNQTISFFD